MEPEAIRARFQEATSHLSQRVRARLAMLRTRGMAWGSRGLARVRQWGRAVWHAGGTAVRAVRAFPLWRLVWQALGDDTRRVAAFLHQRPHSIHRVILPIIVVLVVLTVGLWKVPQWQVAGLGLSTKDRLALENEARQTLAQMIGGLVILCGLYLTWRRIAAAERTVQVTEEGQITERFTRAIDQLGATDEHGKKKLEIRLGGIYALERIARDSYKDHWPIMGNVRDTCKK